MTSSGYGLGPELGFKTQIVATENTMSKGYSSFAGQRAFNESARIWAERDAGQRAAGAGVSQQAAPRPAPLAQIDPYRSSPAKSDSK